jgi:hypothetical protein
MRIPEVLKRKLRYRFFRQKWNVAAVPHPIAVVAGLEGAAAQRRALDAAVWMAEDPSGFRADPFAAPRPGREGEYLIFYEEFPWASGTGRIDACVWNGRRFGATDVSLSAPHHLSYPYVFEEGGRYGYIPEQGEAGHVSLYDFSADGAASLRETLISGRRLLDSTLIRRGGKYWIFATHPGPRENADLHVYVADRLEGPWREHGANPVKADPGNARPAGRPFEYRGELFRPAQNCARYYGESVVINRIVELSDECFSEEPVAEVRPVAGSPYQGGLHTISHQGDFTVIDGARFESKVHPALDALSARVCR